MPRHDPDGTRLPIKVDSTSNGEWLKMVPPARIRCCSPATRSHRNGSSRTYFSAATQKIIDELEGTKRLLIHGRGNPNQDGDIERMDRLARDFDFAGAVAARQ